MLGQNPGSNDGLRHGCINQASPLLPQHALTHVVHHGNRKPGRAVFNLTFFLYWFQELKADFRTICWFRLYNLNK